MPLTEYDDLTGAQKISVTKMYADLSNLRDFLYNWDDKGYHGRRPKPKEERPAKIEPPKVEVPPPPPGPVDEKKDAIETPKPKATRRRRRTIRKKSE